MAIHRLQKESNFKNYGQHRVRDVTVPEEWQIEASGLGAGRHEDPVWEARYQYEASLLLDICERSGYKKIIELGCGPGRLGQIVTEKRPDISYSFVDKIHAKMSFERDGRRGNFYVKDMMDSFDVTGLDTDYDLVVANDFLEHIANPSDVAFKSRLITKERAGFFTSVPNWRMGHTFIYRGLFDFDNWLYFCQTHGWNPVSADGSPLKCPRYNKLDSEASLPDDLVDSWNWYFYCEKMSDNS